MIYKAYDIRGVYPSELNEETAYRIGCAFVTFLGCKEVVVGKDMRSSSDNIFDALSKGITEQGADVINIGLCSTPMFYFAAHDKEAGIMITASHNPPKYNGFKLIGKNITPISEATGILDIKKLAEKNEFKEAEKKGKISEKDVMDGFINHNLKFFDKSTKKLKIVVDAGNGMGAYTFPKVFEKIDCEFIPLYCELDGNFPNHEANPLKPENTRDLQKRVVEEKADFGAAVDGDGDRIVFVDEKGEIIKGDITLALIAKRILKDKPESKMLYTIVCSWVVRDVIEANNGIPVRSRVGHSFIKKTMKNQNIVFGGEISGHYYYIENFFAESSIITTLLLMRILSEENRPLSELIKPLNKYFKTHEINFEVEDKEAKMKEIEKIFSDGKTDHLDGITIEYDDWWFSVRPSNTEPLLRLNLEAKTKDRMEEMKEKISRIISG